MTGHRAFAALAALLAAAGGCAKSISDNNIKTVRVEECRMMFDRARQGQTYLVQFIDPRPPVEFAKGHIPGANNLQLPNVTDKEGRDPALLRYGELIVYGQDPSSAVGRAMTKRLLATEYPRVRFFAGGLSEWKERGYPVDPPSDPSAGDKAKAPENPPPGAP